MRPQLPDDDASQYQDILGRLIRLELALPSDAVVHLVGGEGEPPFENSWINNDNSLPVPGGGGNRDAGFFKILGQVFLQGVIKSGSLGDQAFTLQPGFLPVAERTFAVNSAESFGVVRVEADGRVIIGPNADSTYVFLDGINFRAA